MFISFEGMDGTGKTTQIQLLKAELETAGLSVCVTREPGGTPAAERIREMLLDRDSHMDDWTEAYLYAAARAEHVRGVIRPALDRGEVVLCDRYLDSSLAYQGFGRQLGVEAVRALNARAVDGVSPERTYLFVLGERDAQERVSGRGEKDRMESAGEAFSRRVAEGFLALAAQEPERFCVLNAAESIGQIAGRIREDVAKLQIRRGKSAD